MNVKCPKPGCGQTFTSDKARMRHCNADDDHDYCKKCDYLAKDWDDLTHHKATSPIVHLCCKFCGQDFKSASGRDRHIRQLHPVDQDIRCIGCNEHFVRAAALIEHLEFDHCSKISAQQFKSNIQHKHMVNKLLSDPDVMTSKVFDFQVNDTDTSGGISLSESASLLDEEEKANPLESFQPGGSVIKPLEPRAQPRGPHAPRVGERWPALPSQDTGRASGPTDLSSSMGRMSISGSSGGARLPSCGVPSLKAPSLSPSDSTARPSTSEKGPTDLASQVWTKPRASETLFAGAQKTPLTHEWDAALKARELEYESANSTNMLMQRYWDPTHKDYNPERFYNPVIEMYACPFPQCDDNFQEPFMLEEHINTIHGISQQRCPQCLKLFRSTTALVAHCEAPTSECGISRSDRFGQAIDQFSGGFLGAKDAQRPDFTLADRQDRYVDKKHDKKERGSGYKIGMIKYESTLPLDWPREGFGNNTQIGRSWDEVSRGSSRGPHIQDNMNLAVPLSKSRKVYHSTANIYPQPFQDYVPEMTEKSFAPAREKTSTASTTLAKENDATFVGEKARKKKSKRLENVAAQLIDDELYKKRYRSDAFMQSPKEPAAPMRRADAYYMSGEQPDGDGDDGVSLSASSTAHRSAWE
ncbi:c2h2 finger domain [Diplodia corticola]|uniref:C2h2 finger domain n=1 Tax=Diplodia corticola TaxID=236234 RepID=A0A1J9QPT0_9PEZI|nr:c2h2 finger domain [Diplodia corticola]OJD30464.1 c2h2 finger domain [Diplodia corticola]